MGWLLCAYIHTCMGVCGGGGWGGGRRREGGGGGEGGGGVELVGANQENLDGMSHFDLLSEVSLCFCVCLPCIVRINVELRIWNQPGSCTRSPKGTILVLQEINLLVWPSYSPIWILRGVLVNYCMKWLMLHSPIRSRRAQNFKFLTLE